jgi:uncharacterized protein YeaO (DUF488 family)
MPVLTKRVYEPPAPEDGHRLLVMRFWPRGVRKERVDAWQRDLAPSRELLADFRGGAIDWAEYAERFNDEMASQPASIKALREARRLADAGPLTLLCWCHDETRCHRSLLRDLITAPESANP